MNETRGTFVAVDGNRSKVATAGGILLILTIAMYNWIVSPHLGYLHAAQMQQRMSDTSAAKAAVMGRRLKAKEASLEKSRADMDELQKRFFTPQQASEFFKSIEIFADESLCVINSFSFVKNEQKYDKKDILYDYGLEVKSATLEIVGNYGAIRTFLGKLGGYSPQVFFSGFSVESMLKGTGKLKCSLILTVYVLNNRELFKNE